MYDSVNLMIYFWFLIAYYFIVMVCFVKLFFISLKNMKIIYH